MASEEGQHGLLQQTAQRWALVVGSAGAVGAGVDAAFAAAPGWGAVSVDPARQDGCRWQDVPEATFAGWVAKSSEIVYCAECGNRDAIARDNRVNFAAFVARCLAAPAAAPRLHISYVGGSWTRRQPRDGGADGEEGPVVVDGSACKPADSSNPYTLAKTAAAEAARQLVARHWPRLRVSFWDWISVVPNHAPNFSVSRMVASALAEGAITYSPGDYGRPLLDAVQAGEALLLLAEDRLRGDASDRSDAAAGDGGRGAGSQSGFEVLLMPGSFTRFESFARVCADCVDDERRGRRARTEDERGGVRLLHQASTPQFLRAAAAPIGSRLVGPPCPAFKAPHTPYTQPRRQLRLATRCLRRRGSHDSTALGIPASQPPRACVLAPALRPLASCPRRRASSPPSALPPAPH